MQDVGAPCAIVSLAGPVSSLTTDSLTSFIWQKTLKNSSRWVSASIKCSPNKHSKTSFEKNCFSAWASTLNMGLINKVDMVCLSPVGYGV